MNREISILYLIRHGQTEGNTRFIYQGQEDTNLTEFGKRQAERIGARLEVIQPTAVYSSDLGRALETADIACKNLKVKIQINKGLRERNFGVFQGKSRDQVREIYPEAYELYRGKNPDYRIPGGESWIQFITRVENTLKTIALSSRGGTAALFTHGGVIGSFFTHQLGITEQPAYAKFAIPNGSFTKYEYSGEDVRLLSYGDTHHLDY